MRTFFKIIFSLLFIIIIGVGAGVWYFMHNFDLNSYKTLLEEQARKYTGRTLKINGDAHLGISLIPTLVVNDITFSNAAWSEQPDMLKLKSLQVKVAVRPLLNKQLVISDISLIQPVVYLEKSASGMTNWTFAVPEEKTAYSQTLAFAQLEETSSSVKEEKASPLPEFLNQISIKSISIKDGFIQYADDATKEKQELTLNSLDFNMDSLDAPINANINAVYQQQPLNAVLKLGSFNDLFANNKPFAVNIDANAYNVNALIDGTLLNALNDNISYDLMLKVSSPNGNFNLPQALLETALKGTLSQVAADIKNLAVADNRISGTINADISKKTPRVDAVLSSPLINLTTLQAQKSAAAFDLISSAQALEMIPQTPVPYDLLRLINGNISLNIKKLIIDNAMSADNVVLKASLENGVLNIKPLNLNFGSGKIDMNAVLNANSQSLVLNLNSNGILLQDVHKEFIVNNQNDFGFLNGGKTLLNANLTAQGKTYRQLAQNLNGQLVTIISESKIQTGGLQLLNNSFISQLLSALNINTKNNSQLDLSCAVVRGDFGNGKLSFPHGIAVQSDKLTLSSDGKINMLNDKIDFTITPTFNLETGITQALSSLIKIVGTIEQPKITLDDAEALKTIVGVATTGGLAYLGGQTLTSDNSPCYTALKGTSYQNMVPQPSAASQAQQGAVQGAKDAYNDTKAAIKQELKDIKQNAKDIMNMFKGK